MSSSPTTQAWSGAVDKPPVELPHPVRMRVLGAVMIGVFLAALDQTVVGTALPKIITDLGGNDLYTWAFTAYLLTSTISGPLFMWVAIEVSGWNRLCRSISSSV